MNLGQLSDLAIEPDVEIKPDSARPKSLRRLFQFRLLALLLLVIPVAFVAIQFRARLDNRPVNWKPYSEIELEHHIRNGETVLLFMKADWDFFSNGVEKEAFGSRLVRQLIRSRGVIAMKADYSIMPSRELRDLAKSAELPVGQVPNLIIYSKQSRGEPEIFDLVGFKTIDNRLYDALEKNSSWW